MAGRGSKNAQRSRVSVERVRKYAARTAWHESQINRRIRDNTVAGVVGGLIVIAAVVSQSVLAVVTSPAPEPTETSTPVVTEDPLGDLISPDDTE